MKRKRLKRKKFIPAYAALYTIIFLIVLILAIIIFGASGCDKKNDNPSKNIDSQTEPIKTEEVIFSQTTAAPIKNEDDWALYVIGNNNPLPETFSPETKAVKGERMLDIRCADYAIQMMKDAEKQNVGLYITSAYRTIQKQKENLQSYISTLMSKGYTKEKAEIQAKKEIAMPGCSEHNAGLALDIVSDDYWNTHSDLDDSFEKLPQYKWLIDNSWKYGFILSYPKGKENITGFIYEPWHYRFVGISHAKKMHEIYEKTGEFLTINEYMKINGA